MSDQTVTTIGIIVCVILGAIIGYTVHPPRYSAPMNYGWTARVKIVDVRDSDWNGRYTLVEFDDGVRKFLDGKYGKIGDTFMLQSWQVKH